MCLSYSFHLNVSAEDEQCFIECKAPVPPCRVLATRRAALLSPGITYEPRDVRSVVRIYRVAFNPPPDPHPQVPVTKNQK